jgi:hypothetical protein
MNHVLHAPPKPRFLFWTQKCPDCGAPPGKYQAAGCIVYREA